MIKLNSNNSILFLLEFYIVMTFFAFRNMAIESAYLLGLLFLFLISRILARKRIRISKEFQICFVVVAICIMLSSFFSQYNQFYTIGVFTCLYLLELLEENEAFSKIQEMKPDIFYFCMIVALLLVLYQSYQEGNLRVRTLMGDQNYTGILVFCIFMYSLKRKYISGIFITILYAVVFNNSRGFAFLLLFFLLFWIFKKPVFSIINWKEKRWRNLFLIFVISTALIIAFSVVWVYWISASGYTTVYKGSFNDASNRIRALSILRGVEMLRNTKETFLWGYGGELLEVMGISSTNFASHPTFMGLRLAQPHNTAVNLAVRIGIIPTIAYYLVLSKVLSRYITEDNIPYFFPFFLNSLFMHSLMIWQWLILLVIILSMPKEDRRFKKWRLKRKETANKPYSTYSHR